MTLNAKIGGFMDFVGDFRLRRKSISFTRWHHDRSIVMWSVDPDGEFGICIST